MNQSAYLKETVNVLNEILTATQNNEVTINGGTLDEIKVSHDALTQLDQSLNATYHYLPVHLVGETGTSMATTGDALNVNVDNIVQVNSAVTLEVHDEKLDEFVDCVVENVGDDNNTLRTHLTDVTGSSLNSTSGNLHVHLTNAITGTVEISNTSLDVHDDSVQDISDCVILNLGDNNTLRTHLTDVTGSSLDTTAGSLHVHLTNSMEGLWIDHEKGILQKHWIPIYQSKPQFASISNLRNYFEFERSTGTATSSYSNAANMIINVNASSSYYRIGKFIYPFLATSCHSFSICRTVDAQSDSGLTVEFGLLRMFTNSGNKTARISIVLKNGDDMEIRVFRSYEDNQGITIPKSSFNLDLLDGSGSSGYTINVDVMHKYFILVSTNPIVITFGLYAEQLIFFHQFRDSGLDGANTSSMSSHSLRPFLYVQNTSLSNYTGKIIHGGFTCIAPSIPHHALFSLSNSTVVSASANSETNILAVHHKDIGTINVIDACIRPLYLEYMLIGGGAAVVGLEIQIYYEKAATTFTGTDAETTISNLSYIRGPSQTTTNSFVIQSSFIPTLPANSSLTGKIEFEEGLWKLFGHGYFVGDTRTQPMWIIAIRNFDNTTAADVRLRFLWEEL